MGLFEKKIEADIIFFGEFKDEARGVDGIRKDVPTEQFNNVCRHLLGKSNSGVPVVTVMFDDWSIRKYDISTLKSVSESGFMTCETQEKKYLYTELCAVLNSGFRCTMDFEPKCLAVYDEPLKGCFRIICRIKVKESKLKG